MGVLQTEYNITYKNENVGMVLIKQIGIRYEILAEVRFINCETPFRLAAICGDDCVPLGVMIPDGAGFSYRRTYTKSAFHELGFEKLIGFEIICATKPERAPKPESTRVGDSEWTAIAEPAELFDEGQFRRIFSDCEGCLVRKSGEIKYLAIPLLKERAFPAMPVFCLGESWKIRGKLYMVFKIMRGKLLF